MTDFGIPEDLQGEITKDIPAHDTTTFFKKHRGCDCEARIRLDGEPALECRECSFTRVGVRGSDRKAVATIRHVAGCPKMAVCAECGWKECELCEPKSTTSWMTCLLCQRNLCGFCMIDDTCEACWDGSDEDQPDPPGPGAYLLPNGMPHFEPPNQPPNVFDFFNFNEPIDVDNAVENQVDAWMDGVEAQMEADEAAGVVHESGVESDMFIDDM